MKEQNINTENEKLKKYNEVLANELLEQKEELKNNQHLFNEWNILMNEIENLKERKIPEIESKISQCSEEMKILNHGYALSEQEYNTMKQTGEDTEKKLDELKKICSAETGKVYTLKTIYQEYLDIYDQTKQYQKELYNSILNVKEHLNDLINELKEHQAVYIMLKEESDKIIMEIQHITYDQEIQKKNIENLKNIINDRKQKVRYLKIKVNHLNAEKASLEQQMYESLERLKKLDKQVDSCMKKLKKLQNNNDLRKDHITLLMEQITDYEYRKNEFQLQEESLKVQFVYLQSSVEYYSDRLQAAKKQKSGLEEKKQVLEYQIIGLNKNIDDLDQICVELEKELHQKEDMLYYRQEQICRLKQEINKQKQILEHGRLDEDINKKKDELKEWKQLGGV